MLNSTRIVGLEEHFLAEGFFQSDHPRAGLLQDRSSVIWSVGEQRIEDMDRIGMDVQVLSLMGPGIQGMTDAAEAIPMAQKMNDYLAEACTRHPTRFAGFAALPTQDPEAAATELERTVKDLGFKGALINGHTNGHYLDEDMFTPLWERAVALDVPIYLHPSLAAEPWPLIDGYPEFARAAWGWTAETGAHALRIVGSGLFERMPTAKLIVGHMGEALPFLLYRIDSRTFDKFEKRGMPKKLSFYIRRNVFITTSGMFDSAPLECAIKTMGTDHILFSIDYPLEDSDLATKWVSELTVADADKQAIAHGNAERLLKL